MKSLSTAGAAQEAKSKIFCRDLYDREIIIIEYTL